MSGSSRASSSRGLAALALLLAGCVTEQPLPHATTSLKVSMSSPADPGSADRRLPGTVQSATISVQALDELGQPDTAFSGSIDVYIHSLGALTPMPATITMAKGVGGGTLDVPESFGPTFLWLEDVSSAGDHQPSYATGVSPTLWFREPFIEDIATPNLSKPSSWLYRSPLEGKQVTVGSSRYGADGRLVVTGVFVDGFSVSDVSCAARPCVAAPFAHVYVYTNSRAIDNTGHVVTLGQTIKFFNGGVSEFNGFTEMNFPVAAILGFTPDETLVPDPVVIQKEWLDDPSSPNGGLMLEGLEAGLVAVTDGKVCALDRDYTSFKQWKLDIGSGCGNPVNVITSGQVAGLDPATLVGKKLPRVVGMLKGVNFSSFNVWIVQPRRASDITTN